MIPWIIDFYLNKNELPSFERAYSKNPLVLISSKEAFDFLKANNCQLPIAHVGLSLPDKYLKQPIGDASRKYDFLFVGHRNPILYFMVQEYVASHPDCTYVYQKYDGVNHTYYASTGEELGNMNSREQYFALLKSCKIALYSTPGIDGGEIRTRGFNQVTPRLLELLSSGLHVIARYEENSDTQYYQLQEYFPNIKSYSQFESIADQMLHVPFDANKAQCYLEKHITSQRAKQLATLIETL